MVTLNLSEKISPDILQEPKELIDRRFKEEVDEGDARVIFHLFLDKEFSFAGPHEKFSIRFNEESVKRNTLLFHKTLDFAEEVYESIRSRTGNRPLVDLAICLDEMPFPTSPENHFFLALELSHRGVHIQSLAPRFLGASEKCVDSPGNEETFRTPFYRHALIAQDEGNYKISVQYGIDKFSVLPYMGELAGGGLHLKTAATGWLEAIRLVALVNPSLYGEMHRFALSIFNEAPSVSLVARDINRIPKLEDLQVQELPALVDREDLRQLLGLTDAYLLKAKNEAGECLFKHRLYHTLMQYEEDYWSLIEENFEKQLSALEVPLTPPFSPCLPAGRHRGEG
jgi:hypothetical protein